MASADSGGSAPPAPGDDGGQPSTSPAISLPKGGGAIRGIGETFAVNPATGTGSLSVPIAISPTRGDFGPDLALTYDSGAGNSPFGLGWGLAVPSITRKTDKCVPRYADRPGDEDTFLISGAEDLVPALALDDAAEWHQDRGSDPSDEHDVTLYRPRSEGLFARIERWRHGETGDVHWRSISKQNVTSIFGRGSAHRVVDPAAVDHVFQWLLEESFDDRGNVIAYTYKREDHVGVGQHLVHEANRIRHGEGLAHRYLKRIQYGNVIPGSRDDFVFEIVLDYGEHDEQTPAPGDPGDWTVRDDPFSSFRSGFEIRQYRLCRRILMYHRFDELGPEPCLVRSTDLAYAADPVATKLVAVVHRGYVREGDDYRSRATPPLEFGYSQRDLRDTATVVDPESLADAPAGLDPRGRYQWLDLEGDGVAGMLSEYQGTLYYKRNLGGGRLAGAARLATAPAGTQLSGTGQSIMDLGGDGGADLVQFRGPLAGFYERRGDGTWGEFRAFPSLPTVSPSDPNVRVADLDGDGLSDLLVADDNEFRWYRSLGKEGFELGGRVGMACDEERGPKLVFDDGSESVYLADMVGDGSPDLVRIRNGEVCYWPNVGHGRFGSRVTMGRAPVLDEPDQFSQRRVRLADVDGTGPTDLLYLGRDGVRLHANQAGNAFAPAERLTAFPVPHELAHVAAVDLLGTGTTCLTWSSPLPGDTRRAMRFVDLAGGEKAHLLTIVRNNLGGETRVEYAPSTRFYLEDRAAGRPWKTRLPFPVHVVARTETRDWVADTKRVSTYRYRHGHFDSGEREFRGFGYVEQEDTESFARFAGAGLFSTAPRVEEERLHQPPVVTRTWFHTGAHRPGRAGESPFTDEYWAGDPDANAPDRSSLDPELAPAEERDAARALRGQILRQEVFSRDGSDRQELPYLTTDRTYAVDRVQPRNGTHAVVAAHPREVVIRHYERNVRDPRVTHEITLAVDAWGNVTHTVDIAYRRRSPVHAEQAQTVVRVNESDVANLVGSGRHRIGLPLEARTHELTGLPEPRAELYAFDEVASAVNSAATIAYEDAPTDGRLERRLIDRVRTTYYGPDLVSELAQGLADVRALRYRTYRQAATAGLLAEVFADRVTATLLESEGGYVNADGVWWAPSSRQVHDPTRFLLPSRHVDPFGAATETEYDAYAQLVVRRTDALGNLTTATNHYRTLLPQFLTDLNGNRTGVRFDELGMVVATAVLGKKDGDADLLDLTVSEPAAGDDPTTRIEYDLHRWANDPGPELERPPTFVRTRVRERHGDPETRWQESFCYCDGCGRELMRKIEAEPGLAPVRLRDGTLERDADGKLVRRDTTPSPRWVGTGRTVVDNKGNPIKKYEPFFGAGPEFERERDLVEIGVTPLLSYDPLGRLVRTDQPNGTFSRVQFDAWTQRVWDESDTVRDSAWFAERRALPAGHPERRAADLAEAHADTEGVSHLDALSRAFLNVVSNGPDGVGQTRFERDVEGNILAIVDSRGNRAVEQRFDMLGQKLRASSMDAGESRTLADVLGKPIRTWDSRGHAIRKRYDALRRETHLFVSRDGGPWVLGERAVYGEAHPDAARRNLRGRPCQQYDDAGVAVTERCDLQGNVLRSSRRLALEFKTTIDWTALDALDDVDVITAAAAPLLEPESAAFATESEFDALKRPLRLTSPDGSVTLPTYNESNLLERVDVRLAAEAAPRTFVANIDYNARGQRERISYAGGLVTTYAYDSTSQRLEEIRTRRGAAAEDVQRVQLTYDPVGNVVEIRDRARQTVFFDNAVVSADQRFVFDALYRLVRAEGREQPAGQPTHAELPGQSLPHANDLRALQRYAETFEYDLVGNLLRHGHRGARSWERRYRYDHASNRLRATSLPDDLDGHFSATYDHDAHGNFTRMGTAANAAHGRSLDWDADDKLKHVDLGGGGHAYYRYDADGERVRAVVQRNGSLREERIYLGPSEVFRRHVGDELRHERQTLHVMDDHRRLAIVETEVRRRGAAVVAPRAVTRFQLANHIGSAQVELDDIGRVVSYEEYAPFGVTTYRSWLRRPGLSLKRYRFTGRERDEETGFTYHSARYYAPWLGRWTSADPAGLTDGVNVYAYVNNNPVSQSDPTGMWGWREVAVVAAVVVVGTVVTVATAGVAGPIIAGAVASVGLTGAAATVTTGVVVGAVAGAVGGAASGAVGETTRQVVNNSTLGLGNEQMNLGRVGGAALEGAGTGAAIGAAVGGAAALATTTAGAAAIAGAGRLAQRVVPGVVRSGASAVGRALGSGASAVGRQPGIRQVVNAAGRGTQAVGRGLQRLHSASEGVGQRVANRIFTQSQAASSAGQGATAAAALPDDLPPQVFRGTSEGYPGNPSVQRAGVTPTSSDPVVATIFATEGQNYGRGVVHVASTADLAGVGVADANVLAGLEREIVLDILPTEFASRASTTIAASEARAILSGLGVEVPTTIRGAAGVSNALHNTPRLTATQIDAFVKAATAVPR